MQLIDRNELKFGKNGAMMDVVSRILMKLLSLDKANKIYSQLEGNNTDFADELLAKLGVNYKVYCGSFDNIPTTGGVVVLANHPTGALDGVMLIAALSKIRPDVKFMGNYMLNRIEPLKRFFINVDPFDNSDRAKNLKGIRQSMEHVEQGGALVIFPAGEVATWQQGFSKARDKKWSSSVIRFVRSVGVPVVPMFIRAENSKLFHVMGKIHPMLRTAMLPHELFNKSGEVGLAIGTPIQVKRFKELSIPQLGAMLRANVECMAGNLEDKSNTLEPQDTGNIIPAIPTEVIQKEFDALRAEHLLFEFGDFELYLAPYDMIPNLIREIGRLRELTFRAIGEGSMKECDVDNYDEYYHQLIMWDRANGRIVGGYRMGFGDYIMDHYGLRGFYTDSLFRYDDAMGAVMRQTIELGRSYIVEEYQRKPASLMLLWKGILYTLLKYTQYRNLLGPVTISGEYTTRSKALIVKYLKDKHLSAALAPLVTPLTGLEGIALDIDLDEVIALDSMDIVNKLVLDMEQGRAAIPILIKKYLQLNSRVLAFNVDHDFCDALDALMLLDLKRVPESTISMLSKEITEIDVLARFQQFHTH